MDCKDCVHGWVGDMVMHGFIRKGLAHVHGSLRIVIMGEWVFVWMFYGKGAVTCVGNDV